MMQYVDIAKPVNIPLSAAYCPECSGGLWVEITEWSPDDEEITEGGFDIHCDNENADYEVPGRYDIHAERWQQDWIPVEAKVYKWLLDNVRIADATESDLKDWNQAVKDWEALRLMASTGHSVGAPMLPGLDS